MKKIAIVPMLLTLGNGICGFAAIACASKITSADLAGDEFYFAASGWLIVAAMLFDLLDGYVARLTRTASKFGGELDSLCDAVSFGVAPAFLLLKMGPGWEPRPLFHQLLAVIAAIYMACAIVRLARFNVDNTPDPAGHKRFRGLPSPAAAGCLASLAILQSELPYKLQQYWPEADPETVRQLVQRLVEGLTPVAGLMAALLMVSVVPYPHVTRAVLRSHGGQVIQLLLAAVILFLLRELVLVLLFWIYALGMPLRFLVLQRLRLRRIPEPRLEDGLTR